MVKSVEVKISFVFKGLLGVAKFPISLEVIFVEADAMPHVLQHSFYNINSAYLQCDTL